MTRHPQSISPSSILARLARLALHFINPRAARYL